MSNYEFYFLKDENNIRNKKELIEFEKMLYNSFKKDKWIMKNYITINKNRLRPNIPYEDVFIFIAKKEEEIIAGISGTLNMNNILQLERMGFKIDKKSEKICEGLNFYIHKNIGEGLFNILGTFLNNIINELKKREIKEIYATCSQYLINMYEMFGFEVIDKKKINNEYEYLIKIKV